MDENGMRFDEESVEELTRALYQVLKFSEHADDDHHHHRHRHRHRHHHHHHHHHHPRPLPPPHHHHNYNFCPVIEMSHQGSFSFVFSSMKNKESLSIVSRTFDLQIYHYSGLGLVEHLFLFLLTIMKVHLLILFELKLWMYI